MNKPVTSPDWPQLDGLLELAGDFKNLSMVAKAAAAEPLVYAALEVLVAACRRITELEACADDHKATIKLIEERTWQQQSRQRFLDKKISAVDDRRRDHG